MSVQFPQPGRRPQERRRWIKRATVVLPLLCLVIFGTIIGVRLAGNAIGANADTLAPIKGQVPALVSKSTLVGPTDSNQSLSLSVGLKLRNADSLKAYVDSASRTKSINAHHHLTQAQIAAAYAPLASSQQAVINYLQGFGFQVTSTGKLHLTIGFQGTVGDAENAFHIQINNYRSPKGQNFYANATDPSVPASLAQLIQSIIGLDNARHFTHVPVTKKASGSGAFSPSNISCPGASSGNPLYYLPSQIASAYNLNGFYSNGFNGEGQQVALIEFDDYKSSDISAYTQCFGGRNVPINKVLVDGGTGAPPGAGAVEDELDMELLLSATPHLAGLNVFEAPNSDKGNIDMWTQIIDNTKDQTQNPLNEGISVISTSWGSCESQATPSVLQEENNLFIMAAAQGQTIVAAAGDHGTDDCQTLLPAPQPQVQLAVDDPASQPYVTGVGGTTLNLGSNNSYGSETVWNNGPVPVDQNGDSIVWAGGGGISNIWPMPNWQQGPGVNNSYTSGTPCKATSGNCREVPDVSLNADGNTGYLVGCTVAAAGCSNGSWFIIGGTSAAAPMWAAFMALTNEKTLHEGGFNIGFINPYLYQIDQNANGTSYANDFHDITTGNNDGWNDGGNTYPATANYDMATGLGSYNAWNLANDLEKLANAKNGSRGAPANKTWYFAEGTVGGNYKEYITVLNPSTTPANVSVTYFFPAGKAPVTIAHTIPADVRFTINVNNDLGVAPTAPLEAHATFVSSDVPVVVERPMYFNAHGVASGSDVLGATSTAKTFYFAAGDSRQTSSANSQEAICILNPGTTAANVTVNYYSGGQLVESDALVVAGQSRGTSSPAKFHGLAAIQVVSDQPVVVERTEYFSGNVPNAGGQTTGAAATMGVTTQNTDWLFAEGYTGHDFQENLVLGNFATSSANVTIKLEYTNGTVQTVQQTVGAQSQLVFDVNNANAHPNCSPSSNPPCTVSNSVSIEVTSSAPIVAERVQYFQFGLNGSMHPGIDDVVGQPGPASQTVYSFAEGQTGSNFNDWLTLQNPNSSSVVVAITIFADNTIIQKEVTLPAHSRTSFLINDIVNPIAAAYPSSAGNTVSIDVQSFGGPVVAERPLYFVFSGTTGASDIFGYTGN